MKVGFLSVEHQTVDARAAKIALFDNGHSADLFMTVEIDEIDPALMYMRSVCDAIVVDGNVQAFFDAYKDTLASRPDHFELNGKLHSVVRTVTTEYLRERFIPLLNKKSKKQYGVAVFKTYGKNVDELKSLLKEYMNKKSKVQLGFFPDFLECEIHARCTASLPNEEMKKISDSLYGKLLDYTYACSDTTITERVAQMLSQEGLKIKIAESFTGGALAAAFTAIAGASEYLVEDVVAYSISSKNKRLGVPLEVIAEKGAVSGDTAYNMARGLILGGDCDIVIATTGNAGPSVQNGITGLCYVAIGIASEKSIAVVKYTFDGDREYNIKCGVKNAIFLLYESLISYKAKKLKREKAARIVAAAAEEAANATSPYSEE